MWDYWNYWPMPIFAPLFMLLMIGFCIAMMTVTMRGGMMRGRRRTSSAVDILNERYARGEINKAEYDERRQVLGA
jgi:putative membrane protein